VELFRHGQRLVSHVRSWEKGGYTTLSEHRPAAHQFTQWPPERLQRWAATLGPQTEALVTQILASRVYPEQAYRTCLGILRLGKTVETERLEAACHRALHLGIRSYRGVKSILDHQLESLPLDPPALPACGPHEHVRGQSYYH
jgi:transposase